MDKKLLTICFAMRGRERERESKRIQHFEPRLDGMTNSLTTVGKDNLILEVYANDE